MDPRSLCADPSQGELRFDLLQGVAFSGSLLRSRLRLCLFLLSVWSQCERTVCLVVYNDVSSVYNDVSSVYNDVKIVYSLWSG